MTESGHGKECDLEISCVTVTRDRVTPYLEIGCVTITVSKKSSATQRSCESVGLSSIVPEAWLH